MSTTTRARATQAACHTWPICLAMVLSSLLTLLPVPATAAQPSTATAVLLQTLDFGTFAVLPSCNNCTITIDPSGNRTFTLGVVALSSKNNGRPAQFRVTCNNGSCPYTPTITSAPTIKAGTVTMTMGSFTFLKNPTNTTSTLSVGARLTIPNSGVAVGTFPSSNFTLSTTSP